MIEDDIFKIIVRYPDTMTYPERPAIVKITDPAQLTTRPKSRVESGVESKMAQTILEILKSESLSKSEIAARLGKSRPNRYLNDLMAQMLKAGVVEYTIPDKPNSRLQKYRLAKQR